MTIETQEAGAPATAGAGDPYERAKRVYIWSLLAREDVDAGLPVILESGEGVRVRDVSGRQFLDLMSGHTRASTLGYGCQRIVEAVSEQMAKLHYAGTAVYASDVTLQLAERLADLTPGNLVATAFTGSGSEANEVAIKMARLYQREHGKPRAFKVISRWNGFHGSVGGAQESSDWLDIRRPSEPGVIGFSRIPTPEPFRIPFNMTAEAYWDLAAEYLTRHIEHEGPELVAAFLLEPVAQSNGVRVPPPGYLERVREICDQHQVLLIADEVITGFGRTGQWFAVDHWQIEPDIMTMGKGITAGYLPLAATICREEIRDALTVFPDVHTFGGHASAAVAAATAISIYEDEGLVPRAADVGGRTLARLERLEELPAVVSPGLGMWMAVDFSATTPAICPTPGSCERSCFGRASSVSWSGKTGRTSRSRRRQHLRGRPGRRALGF